MRHSLRDEHGKYTGNPSLLLEKIVAKAENLKGRVANNLKRTKSTPIEIYKNRCLQAVERVGRIAGVSTKQKDNAKRRIFKVYIDLQNFPGVERQTRLNNAEIYLEEHIHELNDAVVEAYSAPTYSGGLGFSTARGLLLADGIGITRNPYFNELNAAKCGPPMDSAGYVPRHKPTPQEFRVEMARQKKEVLSNG